LATIFNRFSRSFGFDCEPGQSEEFSQTLCGRFSKWLESLRTALSRQSSREAVLAEQ